MPLNNHALIRYRTIDRCLKSGDTYHVKDLMRECSDAINAYEEHKNPGKQRKPKSVSRRTIMYDLAFLKDSLEGFDAPIDRDTKEGYYYTDSQFEIFRARIAQNDLEVLYDTLLALKRISGKEQFAGLESVITRLEDTYHVKHSRNSRSMIQFEHSTNIDGQYWVSEISKRIRQKSAVSITYAPFDTEQYDIFFSPYLLKEYNNRWFVIGHEHKSERKLSHLGLDRIEDVRNTLQPFEEQPEFDPEQYLSDVVGVTLYEDKPKVRIRFKAYGKTRHYIRTKPIHEKQETIDFNDEFAVFELNLIPNFELKQKLLSQGSNVEVIAPVEFRDEILEEINRMAARY